MKVYQFLDGFKSVQFAKLRYGVLLTLLAVLLAACQSETAAGTAPAESQPTGQLATAVQTETVVTNPPAATDIPRTEAAGEAPTAEPEPVSADRTTAGPTPSETAPDLLNGSWQQGAAMLTQRSEMPAAVLNGLIYVLGGFGGEQRLEVYDPAADSWQVLADMPDGRHHLMAAAHNGRLYVFGGAAGSAWQPTGTTWVYGPAADSWSELAPMPEERVAGAAVSLGDFLYVVGGTGGSQALLRYDPAADSWTTLAPLNHPREHTAAVTLDGQIYALGGRWQSPGELNSIEIYHPESDTWELGPPMQVARGGIGAAVLDGRIFVAGGEVILSGQDTLNSVEVFDPVSGSWSFAPEMPFTLHGMPAAVHDGLLYIIGGADQAATANNFSRTLIYQP